MITTRYTFPTSPFPISWIVSKESAETVMGCFFVAVYCLFSVIVSDDEFIRVLANDSFRFTSSGFCCIVFTNESFTFEVFC